ncbi:MAG: hypothetical protein R3D85_02905 [Paracoccaceae bacterium]
MTASSGPGARAVTLASVLCGAISGGLAAPLGAQDYFANGIIVNNSALFTGTSQFVYGATFNTTATFNGLIAGTQGIALIGQSSVAGGLCVGTGCTQARAPGGDVVLDLRNDGATEIGLRLQSSATPFDWLLQSSGSNLSGEVALVDEQGDTRPFVVATGASDYALHVGEDGIGFGTMLPQRSLHVVDDLEPTLRLEQSGAGGGTPSVWDLAGDVDRLLLIDVNAGDVPFQVHAGAGNALLQLREGNVGIATGIDTTEARLHIRGEAPGGRSLLIENIEGLAVTSDLAGTLAVRGDDGATSVQIEELAFDPAPRTLLSLRNRGRSEIVLGNSVTGSEWSFGAGTNFVLKRGALGSASNAKEKLFEIRGNGDAQLAGTLVTGGTACGGGCDRVFTDAAIIPAEDYAREMWAQGYLPHVGPTPEGAPLNVSEKLGGMLNALEHAHVFIDRLSAENRALRAELAQLRASSDARLARLEAALGAEER